MPLIRPAELFYAHAFGRITDDGNAYRGAWRYRPQRLPLIFSIYCGLLVPLLAIAGVAMRLAKWTWIAIPLSYFLAIGSNGLIYPFYRWIRYPEKFILFGLFALIILAATAFDRLDRRLAPFLLLFTIGDLALHVNEAFFHRAARDVRPRRRTKSEPNLPSGRVASVGKAWRHHRTGRSNVLVATHRAHAVHARALRIADDL